MIEAIETIVAALGIGSIMLVVVLVYVTARRG